jgi:hypothetical protein
MAPLPVTVPANGRVVIPILFQNIKRKLSELEAYDGEVKFEKAGAIKIDLMGALPPSLTSQSSKSTGLAPEILVPYRCSLDRYRISRPRELQVHQCLGAPDSCK